MKDERKTKRQLINELVELRQRITDINELVELRQRITELKAPETERKRAEEALQESEEKYRSLFKDAKDAIFITDMKTGIILDANRRAEQLIGCPREEIVGVHQSNFHPPDCADWMLRRHMRKGDIIELDAEVVRKDGSIVPVWMSASKLSLRGKKVIQAIFRDIDKEKRILDLRKEIQARKLIERAKIILIGRHRISEKEAMRRLQKESRRQGKKIEEIARRVLSSELILN